MPKPPPPPDPQDPHDLRRFVRAQERTYRDALAEIQSGRKRTHWMWFIFPQMAGLGRTEKSLHYGIRNMAEARAYLAHTVLGPRLNEVAEAALSVPDATAGDIFRADDVKLHSSATLFALASPAGSVFHRLLDRFFDGKQDPATVAIIGHTAVRSTGA